MISVLNDLDCKNRSHYLFKFYLHCSNQLQCHHQVVYIYWTFIGAWIYSNKIIFIRKLNFSWTESIFSGNTSFCQSTWHGFFWCMGKYLGDWQKLVFPEKNDSVQEKLSFLMKIKQNEKSTFKIIFVPCCWAVQGKTLLFISESAWMCFVFQDKSTPSTT